MYAGFIAAYAIEEKYVKFSCDTSTRKKLLRLLGAALSVLLIKVGLKEIFKIFLEDSIFLDMIRYFLMTFVCMGLYPLLFKRNLFKD